MAQAFGPKHAAESFPSFEQKHGETKASSEKPSAPKTIGGAPPPLPETAQPAREEKKTMTTKPGSGTHDPKIELYKERDTLVAQLEALLQASEQEFTLGFTQDLRLQVHALIAKLTDDEAKNLRPAFAQCQTRSDRHQLEHLLGMKLSSISTSSKTRDELLALRARIATDLDPKSKDGADMKQNALAALDRKIDELDQAEKAKNASGATEPPPSVPKPVLSEAEQKADKEARAKLRTDLRRELIAVEANLASAIAYNGTPKYNDDAIDNLIGRITAAGLAEEAGFKRPLELIGEHRSKLAKSSALKATEESEANALIEILHDYGFPAGKKVEDSTAWQQVTDDLLRSLDSKLKDFKPQGAKAKQLYSTAHNMIAKAAQQRKLTLKRDIAMVNKKNGLSFLNEPWSSKTKVVIIISVLLIVILLDRYL